MIDQFSYPKTSYVAPTSYEPEFMRDATLRHSIANELHNLYTEDLLILHDLIGLIKEQRAKAKDEAGRQQ